MTNEEKVKLAMGNITNDAEARRALEKVLTMLPSRMDSTMMALLTASISAPIMYNGDLEGQYRIKFAIENMISRFTEGKEDLLKALDVLNTFMHKEPR